MLTYEQARAAFEAGGRYYQGDRVWLVTRVLRPEEMGEVFWVTDADSLGDVGTLFYPDGRVEIRRPSVSDDRSGA
ncbi:MAG: hypothetical protein ACOYZ7_03165 [Chloroflexota bacterium]